MAKLKLNFSLDTYWHAVVYPPSSRPVLNIGRSFSFVLNISKLQGESSGAGLALGPDLHLRRATQAEVAAIRDVLDNDGGNKNFVPWQNAPAIESAGKISYPPIPEEQWRYFVIAFDETKIDIPEFEQTLSIAPLEIELGFTLLKEAFPGEKTLTLLFEPARLFSQVRRASLLPILPIGEITQRVGW